MFRKKIRRKQIVSTSYQDVLPPTNNNNNSNNHAMQFTCFKLSKQSLHFTYHCWQPHRQDTAPSLSEICCHKAQHLSGKKNGKKNENFIWSGSHTHAALQCAVLNLLLFIFTIIIIGSSTEKNHLRTQRGLAAWRIASVHVWAAVVAAAVVLVATVAVLSHTPSHVRAIKAISERVVVVVVVA